MRLDSAIELLKNIDSTRLIGELAHCRAYPKYRLEKYKDAHPTQSTKSSAVLILFYNKDDEAVFCLIKRPKYDGHHSAQVALPGGKVEKNDASLEHTALRETFEEIGIPPQKVELIGSLTPIYIPVSDFTVMPYIGVATDELRFAPSVKEVDRIIQVKFAEFLSTPLLETDVATDTLKLKAPAFTLDNENIWGATAMILCELQEIVLALQTQR